MNMIGNAAAAPVEAVQQEMNNVMQAMRGWGAPPVSVPSVRASQQSSEPTAEPATLTDEMDMVVKAVDQLRNDFAMMSTHVKELQMDRLHRNSWQARSMDRQNKMYDSIQTAFHAMESRMYGATKRFKNISQAFERDPNTDPRVYRMCVELQCTFDSIMDDFADYRPGAQYNHPTNTAAPDRAAPDRTELLFENYNTQGTKLRQVARGDGRSQWIRAMRPLNPTIQTASSNSRTVTVCDNHGNDGEDWNHAQEQSGPNATRSEAWANDTERSRLDDGIYRSRNRSGASTRTSDVSTVDRSTRPSTSGWGSSSPDASRQERIVPNWNSTEVHTSHNNNGETVRTSRSNDDPVEEIVSFHWGQEDDHDSVA